MAPRRRQAFIDRLEFADPTSSRDEKTKPAPQVAGSRQVGRDQVGGRK
jgi:hypothetical protein